MESGALVVQRFPVHRSNPSLAGAQLPIGKEIVDKMTGQMRQLRDDAEESGALVVQRFPVHCSSPSLAGAQLPAGNITVRGAKA